MSNAAQRPPDPPDETPWTNAQKAEALIGLLGQHEIVRVFVLIQGPGVVLPEKIRSTNGITSLDIGLRMAVPIPDLEIDAAGIRGTFSFSRTPFHITIPWEAIGGAKIMDEAPKAAAPKPRHLIAVTAAIPFDPQFQDWSKVPECLTPPVLRLVPKPAEEPEATT